MLISMDKAVNSAIAFMSGEVSKVASLKDRFLMYAALGAVKNNPSAIVNAYSPMLKSLGLVDDSGMVDTDSLRSALDMGFANVPKVSAFGFTFSQSDADAVISRMEG